MTTEHMPDDTGELDTGAPGDGAEAVVRPRRVRQVMGWVLTVLAGLLVFYALVGPNKLTRFTPGTFARIPVEALLGIAVVFVLPGWARRVAAVLGGIGLGLLTIIKIIDMGFYSVLDRPFNPVLDWSLFEPAVQFLGQQIGEGKAMAVLIAVVALGVALIALMVLATLRLTRLAVRHPSRTAGGATALAAAGVVCALLGVQVVPGLPVASRGAAVLAYDRAIQIRAGLHDRQRFAKEFSVDAFRDTAGEHLLTGLRGKDVAFVFVESYGRVAIDNPRYAQIDALLADGERRLRAAGFGARSGFLTSATTGGGSWRAHATLLSGLWINNQQRYHNLVTSDRLTINSAFKRAGWRTVAVLPGLTGTWPEGRFYRNDKIYAARDLGYHGPVFTLATMPDQFTMEAFQRLERGPGHHPVMAEIALTSSHAPWFPIPAPVPWDQLGDGSVYHSMTGPPSSADQVLGDADTIRANYGRTVEYSLTSLISYVERYGDDNLVLVFLGDHQPAPVVAGEGASRDVPITIVARDKAVLDRVGGWGWTDGLKPDPHAPVWRMNTFRDHFLTAFGPRHLPSRGPAMTPR